MVDNLYPEGGPDEVRRPDAGGLARNAPMADREVPLGGGRPNLLVQQWLDGEVTESAARRADAHEVDLWQRINEETERRRHMITPAPLFDRIMAAIPEAAPVEPVSWWKRPLSLSAPAALATAVALLAAGIALGTLFR
jgi:hypothetical protein